MKFLRRFQDDQGNCLVHYAAKRGFPSIIKDDRFFKTKDFEIKGKMGKLPVHYAASESTVKDKTIKTVEILLDGMNDPIQDQKDDLGNTVFHHSVQNKNDIVR